MRDLDPARAGAVGGLDAAMALAFGFGGRGKQRRRRDRRAHLVGLLGSSRRRAGGGVCACSNEATIRGSTWLLASIIQKSSGSAPAGIRVRNAARSGSLSRALQRCGPHSWREHALAKVSSLWIHPQLLDGAVRLPMLGFGAPALRGSEADPVGRSIAGARNRSISTKLSRSCSGWW